MDLIKISNTLAALATLCITWHIFLPRDMGWMSGDQLAFAFVFGVACYGTAIGAFIHKETKQKQQRRK